MDLAGRLDSRAAPVAEKLQAQDLHSPFPRLGSVVKDGGVIA
jgi:hypothetical protein